MANKIAVVYQHVKINNKWTFQKAYTFNILRFICDPLTQEFVNVGIVIFFPEAHREEILALAERKRG